MPLEWHQEPMVLDTADAAGPTRDSGGGVAPSKALRGIADFSHRIGKALPSLPEQRDLDEGLDSEMAPPPTPSLSSFASRAVYGSNSAVASSSTGGRSLSLLIPADGDRCVEPSRTQPSSLLWQGSDDTVERAAGDKLTTPSQPPLLSNPASAKAGRKRPSKLTLVTPSAINEGGSSSRSVPSSPAVVGRPPPQLRERGGLDKLSPSTTKDLSSTLRGTPRRRPSMPFQTQAKQPENEYQDPGSSKGRTPEAFRDPSEHILSGKGSTLQHARSVYSHGPVEILPGLFLGDEHNARDNDMLSDLGITTVLNVAKETVLPFQLENNTSPLRVKPSLKRSESSMAGKTQPPSIRVRKELDDFFTPPTTAYPTASDLATVEQGSSSRRSQPQPQQQAAYGKTQKKGGAYPASASPVSASYLRNTASTPNLLSRFKKVSSGPPIADAELEEEAGEGDEAGHDRAAEVGALTESNFLRYSRQRPSSSESSDEAYDAASSPSSRADTCTSSATELTPPAPNSSGVGALAGKANESGVDASPSAFIATAEQYGDITSVELPTNAIALKVPASPISSRMVDLRYIKLPWTHDETDLASPGGGFTHGCAIIAEALGIDSRVWNPLTVADDSSVLPLLFQGDRVDKLQSESHKGKVLVHCQCGVSRSATLVIAFVMQAAALRYGFEESRSLMGMHDCYNMVKEKSASISPNILLIYQLVEWERQLSKVASKLREALGGAMPDAVPELASGEAATQLEGLGTPANPGWSVEVLDEEKWSQMRLQEEQKEAEEQQRRRDERLTEAKRAVAERKATSDRLEGKAPPTGGSLGGNSLLARRRKAAPALQLKGVSVTATAVPKPSKPRPPMLNLKSHSSAQADDQPPPETPFLTAKTNSWRAHEDMRCDGASDKGSGGDDDIVMGSVDAATSVAASIEDDAASPGDGPRADEESATTPQLPAFATPVQAQPDCRLTSPPPHSARRSSMTGPASASRVNLEALSQASMATSTAHAPSSSSSGGRSRFSFGGIAAAFTSSGKRRPGSMAASSGSTFVGGGGSGLFGAVGQSKEERRKQHRRTFSNDLPALRAGLELEKLVIPNSRAGQAPATKDGGGGGAAGGLTNSTSINEMLLRGSYQL